MSFLNHVLNFFNQMSEHKKAAIDGLSLATVLGTMASWLPSVAALVSIVWGLIRIYETTTVQGWVKSRATRKKRRKAGEDAIAVKSQVS
jgi:hypothetical protein